MAFAGNSRAKGSLYRVIREDRLIDFARPHWPWRLLFRVLSLSWKPRGSRGDATSRRCGPGLPGHSGLFSPRGMATRLESALANLVIEANQFEVTAQPQDTSTVADPKAQ